MISLEGVVQWGTGFPFSVSTITSLFKCGVLYAISDSTRGPASSACPSLLKLLLEPKLELRISTGRRGAPRYLPSRSLSELAAIDGTKKHGEVQVEVEVEDCEHVEAKQ